MEKHNNFFCEFKEFISRGNVIDLAVGVIIGGAFTSIVNSLVNDIVMPTVGILFGGIDFTNLKCVIVPANGDIPEAAIYYGNFIQNIVNFVLIAFVIFCIIKAINRLHKPKEQDNPGTSSPAREVLLLEEIRDLLAKNENDA